MNRKLVASLMLAAVASVSCGLGNNEPLGSSSTTDTVEATAPTDEGPVEAAPDEGPVEPSAEAATPVPTPGDAESSTEEEPAEVGEAPAGSRPDSLSSGVPDDYQDPELSEAVPREVQVAITEYVEVRDNKMSAYHKEPTDWLGDVKPFVTQDFYGVLRRQVGKNSVGSPWQVAHDEGLSVKSKVADCVVNLAAGVNTADRKVVQCAVANRVIGEDGEPLALTELPPLWPYAGEQPPTMVEMVKEGKTWVVDGDVTGQAS